MPESTKVAVLGLGPMGRSIAGALLDAGRPTTVWNRTPGRAAALVERGALPAATPADAASDAGIVLCCVMNYRAVKDIVGAWPNTVLVNLTSGRATEARDMALQHPSYLDAAILTPAPTIGTPAATILCSGPRPVFERCRSVLGVLAARTIFVGEDPGAAAGYETALLDLFATAVGGVAHAFAMARAEHLDPALFARLASGIGGLLTDQVERFSGAHKTNTGVSTIASLSSTTGHLVESAEAHGIDAGMLRALHATTGRAVTAGEGTAGYPALVPFLSGRTESNIESHLPPTTSISERAV